MLSQWLGRTGMELMSRERVDMYSFLFLPGYAFCLSLWVYGTRPMFMYVSMPMSLKAVFRMYSMCPLSLVAHSSWPFFFLCTFLCVDVRSFLVPLFSFIFLSIFFHIFLSSFLLFVSFYPHLLLSYPPIPRFLTFLFFLYLRPRYPAPLIENSTTVREHHPLQHLTFSYLFLLSFVFYFPIPFVFCLFLLSSFTTSLPLFSCNHFVIYLHQFHPIDCLKGRLSAFHSSFFSLFIFLFSALIRFFTIAHLYPNHETIWIPHSYCCIIS